jgi:hypothetical protein
MKHKILAKKPHLYHGIEKTRPYFEGWYFKHTSTKEAFVLSVICGVSRSKDPKDDHSFIQIITGPAHKSTYIRFPYSDFKYDNDDFRVTIGDNAFSYDRIHLDINNKDISIQADLEYASHIYLESTFLCPSIMGYFSYFPDMECNHGILSMKNNVHGQVIIDGVPHSMDNAAGYIEKDWGESFPKAWIWLQGNVSETHPESSFMCSVASIPLGVFSFTGFIGIIDTGERQYRFATYNSSKIAYIIKKDKGVELLIKRKDQSIKIAAYTESFDTLIAPTRNGMDRELYESVSGEIDVELIQNGKTIFEAHYRGCGIEVSEIGDLVR